ESSSFLFPAGPLPYATLDIVAVLTDSSGKVMEEISRAIRKLPYQKGEVWLGKDMNWYVDGVPFFINGTWSGAEDVNPYYNVTMDGHVKEALTITGHLAWSKPRSVRDKIREGIWDDEVRNFYLGRLQKAKETPNLFAYFFWDEISTYVANIKVAENIYNLLVEEDPYHPVLLTNGSSVVNARNFAKCGDIISRHAYPRISRDVPINDMSKIIRVLEDVPNIRALHPYHRFTLPWLQQGFNYGDVSMRGVRMPSFIERRNEYLLSFLLGADGVIQYNRQYNFYPELYIGVPHHTKEFAFLGDAILAPVSSLSVKSSPASIRTLLKETKKGLFLFVCNAQMEPVKATITVPGIGKHGSQLQVVSEDRTVSLKNESFTDAFDTFEVRVYTTVKEIPDLTPIKEICAAIEKEYAKRKKPGNLAYQRYEDVTLTVTASSNGMESSGGRANNGLWHVADGLCELPTTRQSRVMYWQDTTKNEGPDWIELKFHTMQTIQKVVVFPHEKSLRDYEVQLFIDGNWKTVDKVSNRSDAEIVHTFKAVKTDRIRIWVTATNGPYAKIAEIEVY
ncbi:MAG: discoidin domain-containing protein, partial [Candidatus Ratteibacteria bacterium]